MFTIEYIAKDTGLTPAFIRKCLKYMESVLKPHCTKGDFNQLLFNESGYVLFDQIKQLKAQGLNVNAIKEHLEQQLNQVCKQDETYTQHISNNISTDMSLFNKLFEEKEARLKERVEHQQKLMELEKLALKEKAEHQHRIMELEHLSDHLKSQLLYITSDKSPEEFKKKLQQEQMEKQRISWILKELENLEGIFSVVNYFKRKKLYNELKELMNKQADINIS